MKAIEVVLRKKLDVNKDAYWVRTTDVPVLVDLSSAVVMAREDVDRNGNPVLRISFKHYDEDYNNRRTARPSAASGILPLASRAAGGADTDDASDASEGEE